MAGARAYLDWNATAPLPPPVQAALVEAMCVIGNPSSIHAEGRAARALIERARADVAALVGASSADVVFTSGATEATNAILTHGLTPSAPFRVLASATEHSAVMKSLPADVVILPVLPTGLLDLDALEAALAADARPTLVAVQLANNETGIIQPIAEIAAKVHAKGGRLVVDAVQAPGKLPVDIKALGADVLILSAHKFGGPKGVGAMVFKDGATRLASAYVTGGGQELGQRGGTENLLGIVGMGAAAQHCLAQPDAPASMKTLRDGFETSLLRFAPHAHIVGEGVMRLPNTALFAVPGLTAQGAMVAFDLDGVAVSSGSACSSGKVKASHVLAAMAVPDFVIEGAIRMSIGPTTTQAELDACLASLARQLERKAGRAHAA